MNLKQYRLAMDCSELTNHSEWAVLIALCDFADPQNAEVWAGLDKIMAKARLKETATRNALNSLVKLGHISITKKGNGRNNDSEYQVHVGGKKAASIESERVRETNPLDGEKGSFNDTFNHENDGIKGSFNELEECKRVRLTSANLNKGFVKRATYKDEDNNKGFEEVIYEESETRANFEPENLEEEPPLPTDFLPFENDFRDVRFQSPFFIAILEVCQLDRDLVFWKTKQEAAMVAMTLKNKGFTIAQIKLAGTRWNMPLAPTPLQFQSRIQALLNARVPVVAEKSAAASAYEQYKKAELAGR